MSNTKVYNSFQLKLEQPLYAERIKATAEELFKKTAIRMQDGSLLWDEVDITGGILSAEVFCAADDGDLEKSRELFEALCKTIAKEYSMANYMAKHSFAYANTDTTDYLLCFRKDSKLNFYQAEIVDDVGCMRAKRYSLKYAFMKFEQTDEEAYDDLFFGNEVASNNDFLQVLKSYDLSKYPRASKKSKEKKAPVKPKLEEGKYFHVQYDFYGTKKELIGLLYNHFSETCLFECFGGDTECVEDSDIKSIKEVFKTVETDRVAAEYERIGKEIEADENEMAQLKDEFYALYASEADNWVRRPLEKTDIGQSYPGVEGIEVGGTYLVKVKHGARKELTDAVLVVNRYEDAIGEGFRVMGCVPGALRTNVAMMRPVVTWNLDEFTDTLSISSKGNEIQKQRLELYHAVDDLHGKRKELREEYLKSFAR